MIFRVVFFLCSFNLYAHDFALPLKDKPLPVGQVIKGKEFLKHFRGHIFYKIKNEKETCHGFHYAKSLIETTDNYLITDSEKFTKKESNPHGSLGFTDLSGARLYKANLQGAYLFRGDLRGANLTKTNLSEADLTMANLIDAVLSKTKGVSRFKKWRQNVIC